MASIGTILRSLRLERDLTQTEVAAALNLSPQAVSKWENDSGMPDVTQLVPLADFFGVTVDALLDHNPDMAEEEIAEFIREHDIDPNSETWEALIDDHRKMLRKYPNHHRLLSSYCRALWICPKEGGFDGFPEAYSMYDELIDISERLLRESTDSKVRYDAVFYLTSTYPYQNRYDKVKELAEAMPEMWQCRESILCDAAPWRSEEQRKYEEAYLYRSLWNFVYMLNSWTGSPYDKRTMTDPAETLALYDMVLTICRTYFTEGDYNRWLAGRLYTTCIDAAGYCLLLGRPADAAKYLSDGLDMVEKVKDNSSEKYTSVFMKHLEEKRVGWYPQQSASAKRHFDRAVQSELFADFRETAECAALTERAEKIFTE